MTKQNTNGSFPGTVLSTALFGAIVGGTAAAAKGIRQVKDGEATKEEAAVTVAREAGTTAVAAGAAGAVVGALGLGPVLSTVGIVAVATGAKYAMDSLIGPASPALTKAPASVAKKHAPLIMESTTEPTKKTTAKKTAAKKSTPKKADAPKKAAKKTAKKAASKKATPKEAAARKSDATKAEPKTATKTKPIDKQ